MADANAIEPQHYGGAGNQWEAILVIEAWGNEFSVGNALKYICRAGKKDSTKLVEDLKKAAWYLRRAARIGDAFTTPASVCHATPMYNDPLKIAAAWGLDEQLCGVLVLIFNGLYAPAATGLDEYALGLSSSAGTCNNG